MKECALCLQPSDGPTRCQDCYFPLKPVEIDETRIPELVKWFFENDPVLADAALLENEKFFVDVCGVFPSIFNDAKVLKSVISKLVMGYRELIDVAGALYGLTPQDARRKYASDEKISSEVLSAVQLRILSYIQKRKHRVADPYFPIENRYIAWRIRETGNHPDMSKLIMDPESSVLAADIVIKAADTSRGPMDVWAFRFMQTAYREDPQTELRLQAVRHVLLDDATREVLVKKLLDMGRILKVPPTKSEETAKSFPVPVPKEAERCACGALAAMGGLCQKHWDEMRATKGCGCVILLAAIGVGFVVLFTWRVLI